MNKFYEYTNQMGLSVKQLCSITGYKQRYIVRLLNYGITNKTAAKHMAKKLMITDWRRLLDFDPQREIV